MCNQKLASVFIMFVSSYSGLVPDHSSECLLNIDKGVNTVDHVLDELFLGFTESSSVGDIEDSIVGLGVLSVDTSDLDLVLVSDLVELFLLGHELWKVDVDGSSHGGTKVGWA